MRRYLPYVAVTLLAAACTNRSADYEPGTYQGDHGTTGSADGGEVVAVDPVTGEPVGTSTDSSTSTGGGTAGPGGTVNPGDASNPDAVVPDTPLANCDTPGPRLIRRLTAEQYENTLTQLMGEGFPADAVLS